MSCRRVNVPGHLYPWQRDLLKRILEGEPGKWYVVKAFRQNCGKTHALENLIILLAFIHPKSVSLFIEPSNSQASKVGAETYAAVAHLGVRYNASSNIMLFPNGSRVYFKSSEADPKTIRGYTARKGGVVVVDEGAFVGEEYFNALFPVVQKHKASLILASTPDRTTGTFYELYEKGKENDQDKIVSINWSKYLDVAFTEEELKFYKEVYSSRRYRTEVLGEFDLEGGSVFQGFDKCIGIPEDRKVELVSIDWGVGGSDYTAVVFWNKNKEVVDLKYFNNLTPVEQVKFIVGWIKECNPKKVIVESNSIGNVYYDMLKRDLQGLVNLEKFNTSNSSKCEIVDRLQAGFEHKSIMIPDDEELLKELRSFEETSTKSGLRTYSCPPPVHDDLVMALAIGYWRLNKNLGVYSIGVL